MITCEDVIKYSIPAEIFDLGGMATCVDKDGKDMKISELSS